MDCQVISDLVDYCSQQRFCLRSERSSVAIENRIRGSRKSPLLIERFFKINFNLSSTEVIRPFVKWTLLWIWNKERQRTQWPIREVTSFNGSYVYFRDHKNAESNQQLCALLFTTKVKVSFYENSRFVSWTLRYVLTYCRASRTLILLWTAVKIRTTRIIFKLTGFLNEFNLPLSLNFVAFEDYASSLKQNVHLVNQSEEWRA